jgi:hypothetical protein
MHHEVEDDVDIERAWCEDAEPVRLKEHGHVDIGVHCEDGGVEALQVADLEDALVARGQNDERIGFGQRRCDGLFDQDIDAGLEQGASDCGVSAGGHAYRRGVKLELAGCARGEARVYVVKYMGVGKIRLQRLPTRGIAFDDGRKADRVAGSCAQFANYAKMIAAEGTCADDDESDGLRRGGRHWS